MSHDIVAVTPRNPDVSVVILTRNSALTIEGCLKSIIEERPGEIVAVDALSSDETVDILNRYQVTVVVDSQGSIGYSRQLGVEAAKGAYVMFVDSDAELSRGCIAKLRSDLNRSGWAGIHATILSRENESYWQKAENQNLALFFNRVGATNHIRTTAALFRREVLLTHPFDANFREAAEDGDLCRRLVLSNHRLGVSDALAYHRHRRDFTAFVRQRFGYGLGNARFGLKYRVEIQVLADPFLWALYRIVFSVLTNRITLVPFWCAAAIAQFFGVFVGLSRRKQFYAQSLLPLVHS